MEFSAIQDAIMAQAKDKGFGTTPEELNVFEKLLLVHSEVTEAFDAYRKKDHDLFAEELGDIVQRVLHIAGAHGIDTEEAILQKIEKNKARTWSRDKRVE